MTDPGDPPEHRLLPPPTPREVARRTRPRRTWPQRLVIIFNSSIAFACLLTATIVWYANDQIGRRQLIDISDRAGVSTSASIPPSTGGGTTADVPATQETTPGSEETSTTLPVIDVTAKNFLLTGSDARGCIDPNSPYAGAYLGNGNDIGQRSDTIMMLRVDPTTKQAIVLSFPRDLWVTIAGSNHSSRINAAFDPQNPKRLMDTIWENFGVLTDHYINVDFCAFKDIVDAAGGVRVPFAYATRDANTGLDIPGPECHLFGGDEALAYVRSRHYKYFDPQKNAWVTDGTSDYGRITRQQDFLKRAMAKVLANWKTDPALIKGLLEAFQRDVTTDTELSIKELLDFAQAMRNYDANGLRTYQIAGVGVRKGNASVIEPKLNGPEMQALLQVFRGQATLADAPTGPIDPGDVMAGPEDTAVDAVTTSSPPAVSSTPGAATTVPEAPTTTSPIVAITDVSRGIYPPDDPDCH